MKSCVALFLLISMAHLAEKVDGQDVECGVPDYAYAGANILISGSFNLKDNAEDCQRSCQAITGCDYWTWYSEAVNDVAARKFCNIHYDFQGTINEEGTVSGPKNCEDP